MYQNLGISKSDRLDEIIESLLGDSSVASSALVPDTDACTGHQRHIYASLITHLVSLHFTESEAVKHWRALIEHRELLQVTLGRDVGIRVAALDYFSNVNSELVRPRVIEDDLFERLICDASRDALTGVYNRGYSEKRLATEFNRAKRYGNSFVMAVFDIDHFKRINDTYGHSVGDEVLQRFARILETSARQSDLIGRWGGEEFIMLMPETTKEGGEIVAERVRTQTEIEIADYQVTVSGGLAAFPYDGLSETEIFTFADQALYFAKESGRNRISLAPRDRRAYPRVNYQADVQLKSLDTNNIAFETRTLNISKGGFQLRSQSPFEPAHRFQGEIAMKDRKTSFIGRVVRTIAEEQHPGEYCVGLQFIETNPPMQISYDESAVSMA